mgnify:CR=1 FL=1
MHHIEYFKVANIVNKGHFLRIGIGKTLINNINDCYY